jgi:hypothetical protein
MEPGERRSGGDGETEVHSHTIRASIGVIEPIRGTWLFIHFRHMVAPLCPVKTA